MASLLNPVLIALPELLLNVYPMWIVNRFIFVEPALDTADRKPLTGHLSNARQIRPAFVYNLRCAGDKTEDNLLQYQQKYLRSDQLTFQNATDPASFVKQAPQNVFPCFEKIQYEHDHDWGNRKRHLPPLKPFETQDEDDKGLTLGLAPSGSSN